jgi:hypothetical protein
MTLYYYMCRSWQDCCRRGENQSWPSVSVESVDSECWCLNNAISYAFIMRLTVEERVFILESYLKTMSYAHCRQSFFGKFRILKIKFRILKMNITHAIEEVNERTLRKVVRNIVKCVDKCTEMNGHHFSNTYCKCRLVV